MKYNISDISKTMENYQRQTESGIFSKISIEILPNENAVDPMLLIEIVESDRSTKELERLAIALTRGKKVKFTINDENEGEIVLKEVQIPAGGVGLGSVFIGEPYLLQALLTCAFGIMMGKLSVPSSVLKRLEGTTAAETADSDKPQRTK